MMSGRLIPALSISDHSSWNTASPAMLICSASIAMAQWNRLGRALLEASTERPVRLPLRRPERIVRVVSRVYPGLGSRMDCTR